MKKPLLLGKIALSLCTLLICFILAELFLYFLYPAPKFIKIEITTKSGGRYELSPNYKLLYVPKPNTWEFNADGYRGKLFPLERQQGKKRIVFVGDSVTEGVYIPVGQRFTDVLNDKLGSNYEFINLGVPGYNLIQEVEYVKDKALKYKPDYVIIGICANDESLSSDERSAFERKIERMENSAFYRAYYQARSEIENKLLMLNTYRFIKFFLGSRKVGGKRVPFYRSLNNKLDKDEIREQLQTLLQLADKNKFKASLIFLACANGIIAENIKEVAEEEKIPFLDLWSYITEKYDKGLYQKLLLDFGHFNKAGHKVVADVICEHYNFSGKKYEKD